MSLLKLFKFFGAIFKSQKISGTYRTPRSPILRAVVMDFRSLKDIFSIFENKRNYFYTLLANVLGDKKWRKCNRDSSQFTPDFLNDLALPNRK